MWARWLADGIVVAHAAFVAFVVAGGLAVWRWPRLALLHLPACLWGAWIELSGGACPLTPLELRWRAAAGQSGYEGDFIGRYLMPVLYPAGLTREVQVALGFCVVAINVGAYGWLLVRRRSPQG